MYENKFKCLFISIIIVLFLFWHIPYNTFFKVNNNFIGNWYLLASYFSLLIKMLLISHEIFLLIDGRFLAFKKAEITFRLLYYSFILAFIFGVIFNLIIALSFAYAKYLSLFPCNLLLYYWNHWFYFFWDLFIFS